MILEQMAKKTLGLVVRAPLPPPLVLAVVVAETVLLACAVAREVQDLIDDKKGGG